jgi:hypothetical protein
MNPGADCLLCHTTLNDGGLASYRPWTLAGTVFTALDAQVDAGLPLAQVMVTDSTGKQLTMLSNAAGNFYTAEPLADLVDIEIQKGDQRMIMQTSVVGGSLALVGSCNRCHQDTGNTASPTLGILGAPGRLFVPPN